jgi:hypothetical protein
MTHIIIRLILVLLAPALLAALIFLYPQIRKRKRHLALARAFERYLKTYKLSIEETDYFDNKAIGLDKKNKRLLLIDHSSRHKEAYCICLQKLHLCEVKKIKDPASQSVSKIVMEFLDRNNKLHAFTFYDRTYNKRHEKPLLSTRAEYWKERINRHKSNGDSYSAMEYLL